MGRQPAFFADEDCKRHFCPHSCLQELFRDRKPLFLSNTSTCICRSLRTWTKSLLATYSRWQPACGTSLGIVITRKLMTSVRSLKSSLLMTRRRRLQSNNACSFLSCECVCGDFHVIFSLCFLCGLCEKGTELLIIFHSHTCTRIRMQTCMHAHTHTHTHTQARQRGAVQVDFTGFPLFVCGRIPYYFSACHKYPGKFLLSYMPRNKSRHEYFSLTPEGLRYRQQIYPSLNSMIRWFKEHFRDPIPGQSLLFSLFLSQVSHFSSLCSCPRSVTSFLLAPVPGQSFLFSLLLSQVSHFSSPCSCPRSVTSLLAPVPGHSLLFSLLLSQVIHFSSPCPCPRSVISLLLAPVPGQSLICALLTKGHFTVLGQLLLTEQGALHCPRSVISH